MTDLKSSSKLGALIDNGKFTVKVSKDLQELLPRFLENREKDLSLLREALKEGNFTELESLGHKLKGTCGGYDFDELGNLGLEIENAAKVSNSDEIHRLIETFRNYLRNVEVEYV